MMTMQAIRSETAANDDENDDDDDDDDDDGDLPTIEELLLTKS